jgi:hypothetical protein
MAIERHCMYHCMYQQAKILYMSQIHRRKTKRDSKSSSTVYDIHLMRVNLTWMYGDNSCTPPCNMQLGPAAVRGKETTDPS